MNHKRVARLIDTMGLEAIHPNPELSQPSPDGPVCAYLLRNVAIRSPEQLLRGDGWHCYGDGQSCVIRGWNAGNLQLMKDSIVQVPVDGIAARATRLLHSVEQTTPADWSEAQPNCQVRKWVIW